MKILIIQPWISYRGAESVSVQQAYHLSNQGAETAIAALFVDWKRLPLHGEDVSYILPQKTISKLLEKSRLLLFIFGPLVLLLLVLVNSRKFDVLNPHNLPGVWIAVLVGKLFKKKVIWTVHSIPHKIKWNDRKGILDYFIWFLSSGRFDIWLAKKSDVIIAVSNSVSKQISQRYKRESIVLYSGIQNYSSSKKINSGLKKLRRENKLVLLQVGALHPQKRNLESLYALKKFLTIEPKTILIFAGDGPDRQKLEQEVDKLKIAKYVLFTGYVNQEQIRNLYLICDLHLLPSINESFAASPLEALISGKLSIVTKDSGVLEVLGKYVLAGNPNSTSIYNLIKKFYKDKQKYKKLAISGSAYIRKLLNWTTYAKEFIKIASDKILDVPSSVYDKDYYSIHYEKEHEALQLERVTRMQRAFRLLSINKDDKILDLGCGIGDLSIMAASHGANVYGIDYSSEGIQLAENKRNKLNPDLKKKITFLQMDVRDLNFPDHYFDKIVSIDVFEHIYETSINKVIKEMVRVIKPGGKIVIETSPNKFYLAPISFIAKTIMRWNKFESEEYHINVYDYFRLKETLKKIPGQLKVDVLNDSHLYFSSRLAGVKKIPKWIFNAAKFIDFLTENKVIEPIILHTPLKILFAHDLWAVIDVEKNRKKSV